MSNTQQTFQLTGLHCQSCKKITEKRVKKVSGVTQAQVDLDTAELVVIADRVISKQEIAQVLSDTDYQVT